MSAFALFFWYFSNFFLENYRNSCTFSPKYDRDQIFNLDGESKFSTPQRDVRHKKKPHTSLYNQ